MPRKSKWFRLSRNPSAHIVTLPEKSISLPHYLLFGDDFSYTIVGEMYRWRKKPPAWCKGKPWAARLSFNGSAAKSFESAKDARKWLESEWNNYVLQYAKELSK